MGRKKRDRVSGEKKSDSGRDTKIKKLEVAVVDCHHRLHVAFMMLKLKLGNKGWLNY